jgi:hypothetical protein
MLLVGAGPGALATLGRLPKAAEALSVRVAGPFGLIAARGVAGRVRTSNCFWLSEIAVPEPGRDTIAQPDEFDDALFGDACSLLRRLRAEGQVAAGGARVQIHAYVVMDLAVSGIVPFIVRLVQLVRRADPAIDMTGLALTGRTVETGTSESSAWHDTVAQLMAALEESPLLQRLYILDGEDTSRTWLRNPEEMQRIGAEFILHHGLSPYRHHLRRREKTRTSLREVFLGFCGSAMCKRFHWDPLAVAREIAATVAHETSMEELDQGVLTQERCEALEGLVQRLVTDVSVAYQKEEPPAEGAVPQAASSAEVDPDKKVLAALEERLKEVCAETPVLSLRWFVSRLRLRLDELTTFSRLRARWDSRHRVARALQGQVENTYAPIKRWQEQSDVRWQTPFRPSFKETPSAVLSQPVPMDSYFTGVGLAAAGLGLVALGRGFGHSTLMVAGGIAAIWSSLVTALATGWVRRRRPICLDDESTEAVSDSHYQLRPSVLQKGAFALLLAGALACLGWSLWAYSAAGVGVRVVLLGVLTVACGVTGAALVSVSSLKTKWPEGTLDEDRTPDLAPPRNPIWFAAGLLFLTAAWASLCGTVDLLQVAFPMGILGAGLALAWAGAAVVQFPRYGRINLAYTGLKKPVPPAPLEARSVELPHLAGQVEKLRSWADRMVAASEPLHCAGLDWNQAGLDDPLPRMFSPHWHSQLAQAFRSDLERQTGKTLEQLIADPANWARSLVEGLSETDSVPSNPLYVFCLSYVRRWLEDKPLERIISQLTIERGRLVSAVSASAPPRWPQTRDDPEIDASVIAVGKELWDVIAPFMDPDEPHRFVVVDWREPYTVAVVRTVQGLSRGWRGYPGLPGQSELMRRGDEPARLLNPPQSSRVDRPAPASCSSGDRPDRWPSA